MELCGSRMVINYRHLSRFPPVVMYWQWTAFIIRLALLYDAIIWCERRTPKEP